MPLYQGDPQEIVADFGQGEVELYVWPLSLSDMKRIRKSEPDGEEEQMLTALIVRARNKDRSPMFNNLSRKTLLEECPPKELMRVILEMKDGLDDDDEAGN